MKSKIFLMILILLSVTMLISCKKSEPEFFLNPGHDTITVGDTWIDAGAYLKAGNIIIEATASGSVNTRRMGVYEIIYSVVYQAQTISKTRYVFIVDLTPPFITLKPGVDSILLGDTWIDAGVNVSDNSRGDIHIEIIGEVDIHTANTYVITYIATDESGNRSKINRYVTVYAP